MRLAQGKDQSVKTINKVFESEFYLNLENKELKNQIEGFNQKIEEKDRMCRKLRGICSDKEKKINLLKE